MKNVKGFVEIHNLVSNTPGVVSIVGEMSNWAATFSKEHTDYKDVSIPGYCFYGSSIVNQLGTKTTITSGEVSQILRIARAFYIFASNNIRPYDRTAVEDFVVSQFPGEFTGLKFGTMVDNGSIELPQWVSYRSITNTDTFVKFWLSDTAFATQLDTYETTVIAPVLNLDSMFADPAGARAFILNESMTDYMVRVQDAKARNPETFVRSLTINYQSPIFGLVAVPSNWTVLIHGVAGDNIDTIKESIIDYILANSTHNVSEWVLLLPDLFKRTEFVVVPRWDKYSIPNMLITTGLYSSIVDPREVLIKAESITDFYAPGYSRDNVLAIPFPYKDISLLLVNGPNNVPDKSSFLSMFGDYIPEPTTSLDFNRMTIHTRELIILFYRMLVIAELTDIPTDIPNDMRVIIRNNKTFISAMYDGVHYLVYSKINI